MIINLLKQPKYNEEALTEDDRKELIKANEEVGNGVAVGGFATAVTIVVAIIATIIGEPVLGLDSWAFLDAIAFGILVFGMLLKNRFATWSLVVYYVIGKLYNFYKYLEQPSEFSSSGLMITLAIAAGLYQGLQGVLNWHRLIKAKQAYPDDKGFEWKQSFLLFGMLLAVFGTAIVIGLYNNRTTQLNPVSSQAESTLVKDYTYTSAQDGFSAVFPNQPQRIESELDNEDVGAGKTISYNSEYKNSVFSVYIFAYNNKEINENSPQFNKISFLEEGVNSIANTEGVKLLTMDLTMLNGEDIYKYEIEVENERLDGYMLFKGNKLYNVSVDYQSDSGAPNGYKEFLDSFKLVD